ncbi:hypothetical protein [Nonomuraea sp. NPDC050643]|uniref:sensor histidine kinase n=1 Tax=Nonomuraea sp. NPDC050643 TaxID=3155660 RepID=UPI0033C80965
MRRDEGGGRAGEAADWSWSDPGVWEANACGEVTPAQRAVLVGPRVRPPVLAWLLLAVLVIVEGGAGMLGATPKVGLLVEGGPVGAVATMVFMMVVLGWQLLLAALVAGVPKWGDRRARRRMIAELAACRVGSAVGEVVGARHARVGALDVRVNVGRLDRVPAATSRAAFAIAREALTNALRHGQGPITMDIATGGNLLLTVENRAADVSPPTVREGRGLAGMRMRARLAGGTCTREEVDGTWRIQARLPM